MSTLRTKMIELLRQDRKREYLNLCTQDYAEAVSIAQEIFPEQYKKTGTGMDPFDSLYDKALEMKERGNTEDEIRILETAVQNGSAMPYCYERLSILYSKQKNYKRVYEICMKWFDAVFWKLPNASTSSLRLLERLEKLREKQNNAIITSMRISLEKANVKGIPEYIKKLRDNSTNSENFENFRLEGRAALMFSGAGFCVTMRESPDLALKFNNEEFYAEVKHFRKKEQDRIDDARMSDPNCCVDEFGPYLSPYGDTFQLEGKYAHEQVYDVAKKKINQYKEHAPNILVIESSSSCIEDTEIRPAIDMINEDVSSGKCPGLAKLICLMRFVLANQ
ncbi:MAG: hypothetical protein A2144_02655 [Chloroflexi bacterium RBG_16_50_9]|nr:MAG: hypothetical protein A2144_02655 [Chloroflexi bacterium RBG_16_50_9]